MARERALLGLAVLLGILLSGCVQEAVVGWQVPNTGAVDVWVEDFPDGPDASGQVYVLNRSREDIDVHTSPEEEWGRVTLAPDESGHYAVSYGVDLTVEYTDGEGDALLELTVKADLSSSVRRSSPQP